MKLPVNALLVDTQGAELTVSTSAPKFVSPMKAQPPLSTVQRPPGAVPVPSPGESPQTAVMLLLAGLGYLVIGLTVVAFTFFFCYSVVWVGYNYGISAIGELVFSRKLHLSHHQIVGLSSVFVAFLFLEQALVKRSLTDPADAQPLRLRGIWLAGLIGSCCGLLANARVSSAIITDLLLLGPRMTLKSLSMLRRSVFLLVRRPAY
jgi:hypothetical protein